MSDPIRAALERLHQYAEIFPVHDTDAILAAARAALAEQQGEGPSESDVAELFYRYMGAGPEAGFENAIAEALARWGRQPAPHDDRGVLPMVISDTGASDEPERERIICASISGGADYVNNMPRTLTLERIELHKDSTCGITNRRYIQEPTPPAEGEVAELVELLHKEAAEDEIGAHMLWMTPADARRAAELLQQQQHPTPVPVRMIPVEYWDIDSGARIVSEPSEEGPGGCWVVLDSRHVNPLTEFPTAKAAWDALQQAHALPLPQGEVEGQS